MFLFLQQPYPGPTESISHPVHLKKGSPSALIPYCAYATSLTELGSALEDGDNFPVCDKFTPVLLEGELCYQLNVTEHTSTETSFGPNHALMLLIDRNEEKSASVAPEANLNGRTDVVEIAGGISADSARIYLHTLPGEQLPEVSQALLCFA